MVFRTLLFCTVLLLEFRTLLEGGWGGGGSPVNPIKGQSRIHLVLANDGNKNSNCCVDKAINELESELIKISPDGSKLSTADLAQATMSLNGKIRKRGFTASEIHFSRDSHDNSNLVLDDSQLQENQRDLRFQNHQHLNNSRAPRGKTSAVPDPDTGDIVYLKNDISKHTARDPFIVMKTTQPGKSLLKKAIHSSSFATQPPKNLLILKLLPTNSY